MNITRHIVEVNGREVHYRRAGTAECAPRAVAAAIARILDGG